MSRPSITELLGCRENSEEDARVNSDSMAGDVNFCDVNFSDGSQPRWFWGRNGMLQPIRTTEAEWV